MNRLRKILASVILTDWGSIFGSLLGCAIVLFLLVTFPMIAYEIADDNTNWSHWGCLLLAWAFWPVLWAVGTVIYNLVCYATLFLMYLGRVLSDWAEEVLRDSND